MSHTIEEQNERERTIRLKQAAAQEMYEALKGIMALIEKGDLIRDISHDSEPGYSLKMLEMVRTLQTGSIAIAKAEGK